MDALIVAEPVTTNEFDRWWHTSGAWVEPANQRRGGDSGVQLLQPSDPSHPPLYCKRQNGHLYRSLSHPFGRPTVLRELRAYQALARLGIATPQLVYCGARKEQGQWQALLVTEALQGFVSLEQWYASHNGNDGLRKMVLRQLALTLARLHRAGWQHGCCYPKHIFVRLQPASSGKQQAEIALLDLEKGRRRWYWRNASRHDLGQLERHRGNIPISDLQFLHGLYQLAVNGASEALQS